jgi:hypothetical protein
MTDSFDCGSEHQQQNRALKSNIAAFCIQLSEGMNMRILLNIQDRTWAIKG